MVELNPLHSKLSYFNFHHLKLWVAVRDPQLQLEVVGRGTRPTTSSGGNYTYFFQFEIKHVQILMFLSTYILIPNNSL